ncbi:MAG: LURP-one-related/scramblase family protein [Tepidisphaeraceae bacterium]
MRLTPKGIRAMRYAMKERVFAHGRDYTVRDEAGRAHFVVGGVVIDNTERLSFRDTKGREMAFVRNRNSTSGPAIDVFYADELCTSAHPRYVTPYYCRFSLDTPGPDDLEAHGNLSGHEYVFKRGNDVVAVVSKAWFPWGQTYGVDVSKSEDEVLILACSAVVDLCCQPHHPTPHAPTAPATRAPKRPELPRTRGTSMPASG